MEDNKFQPVKAESNGIASQWPGFVVLAIFLSVIAAVHFGGVDFFKGIIMLLFGLAIYLLPSAVALNRKHNNRSAIITLNILLGWTFLGWAGALVWAMTKDVEKAEGT